MLTSQQIEVIQQRFAKIAPVSDRAAAMFSGRLFEIAPDTRSLFRGDMAEQGRKLMATLFVVVSELVNLDAILPAASALAKRHVSYGVKASHYALLWTLEKGLGSARAPELAAAWTAAYTTLSGTSKGPACVRKRESNEGC